MIRNRRGQIVIEYILLLVVAVTISAVLIRGLANRSDASPGLVVEKWRKVEAEIGGEMPDRCTGDGCNQ